MPEPEPSHDTQRIVLVTGPSGAGRSTAINALEDLGYETISNLPIAMIPRLLDGELPSRPLALGVDVRGRDFSVSTFEQMLAEIGPRAQREIDLLYLDCSDEVLVRRYSETRRRHPLAAEESPGPGIAREKALLQAIRARADVLIDTTHLNLYQLRAEIARWFASDASPSLAITIESFSYKRGLSAGLDLVLDCRFLNNPHWVPALRAKDGRDAAVAAHVAADPRYDAFLGYALGLVRLMMPSMVEDGRPYLSVGFGCTGGQHRSVAVAVAVAKALADEGCQVSIRHRELENRP